MGFVHKGEPITTKEAKTLIREDLTGDEAFEQFVGILRSAVAAVTENGVAEVDVEREVEGKDTVRITVRREPFRVS